MKLNKCLIMTQLIFILIIVVLFIIFSIPIDVSQFIHKGQLAMPI